MCCSCSTLRSPDRLPSNLAILALVVGSKPFPRWRFGLVCAISILATGSIARAQAPGDWNTVKVPEVWKNPPAGIDNLSWYRGFVKAPEAWQGKELELFVEPTDAAHEVFFNGKKIGGAGEFPPFFRSGLGAADRYFRGWIQCARRRGPARRTCR